MTKMTLLLSLALASTTVFTACNKSSDGKTAETAGPVDTTQTQNPNTGGLGTDTSATAYYNQFLFRMEGDCRSGGMVRTYSIANVLPMNVGTDGLGRNLGLTLNLSIYANGTYQGLYKELTLFNETNPRHSSPNQPEQILYQTVVSGAWHLERNQIVLDGLGTGSRLREGSVDKVLFKISQRLNRPQAMNSFIPLQLVLNPYTQCGETGPYSGSTVQPPVWR